MVLKKIYVWGILAMLLVACQGMPIYTLELSEQDIAQKLSRYFPITKDYTLLQFTVNHPNVRLNEGEDRLKFTLDVELKIALIPQRFKGQADISGKINYVPAKGTFYFTQPIIHSLKLPGIPTQYTTQANQLLTTLAQEFLNEIPVYTLDPKDTTESIAKLGLQKILIRDKKLKIQMGLN